MAPLLTGADPALLTPPVNVLRLGSHPNGVAPRILNLPQWRAHLLDRLRRQSDATADPGVAALLRELCDYPAPVGAADADSSSGEYVAVVVPLRLATPSGPLTLFTTTTVFGMPGGVTLSELAVESFSPADPASAALLHEMARREPVAGG